MSKTRLLGAAICFAVAAASFYMTHNTTFMYVFGAAALVCYGIWYKRNEADDRLKRQAEQQIPPSTNENKGNQTLEVPPSLED